MKTSLLPLASIAAFALALAGCGKPSTPAPAASGTGNVPGEPAATATAPAPTADAPTGKGGPADLRLKWTPGQAQQQRMGVTMKFETSGGPLPNPIKQEMAINMESTVTPVGPRPEGGYELNLVLGDTDMAGMFGGQEMRFDTRGEALGENADTGVFRALVGSKLKYLLDSSNHVEKVEGWQEVVKKATSSGSGAGRGMMAGMLTEDYFKQLGAFGRGLPNRTVKPGETWQDKQEVVMGPLGRMILDLTFTFKGWETHDKQNCAAVTFGGPVTAKAGDASGKMASMKVDDGKTSGTYWFNPETGRFTEVATQQDMTMSMQIPSAGQPAGAGGGAVTTRLTQKTQLTFSPEQSK